MSDGQYDNSNRGVGWPVDLQVAAKTLRIKADIGGEEFYGILIRTGAKSDKAPTHNLFLYPDRSKTAHLIAIFRNDKGGHKLAGGELTLPNGIGYWVSLFANKSEHPQSPVLDLSFQPKEVQQQQPQDGYSAPAEQQEPVVPEVDDIPF